MQNPQRVYTNRRPVLHFYKRVKCQEYPLYFDGDFFSSKNEATTTDKLLDKYRTEYVIKQNRLLLSGGYKLVMH